MLVDFGLIASKAGAKLKQLKLNHLQHFHFQKLSDIGQSVRTCKREVRYFFMLLALGFLLGCGCVAHLCVLFAIVLLPVHL
jgi:hypothetical protein